MCYFLTSFLTKWHPLFSLSTDLSVEEGNVLQKGEHEHVLKETTNTNSKLWKHDLEIPDSFWQ